MCIFQRLNNSEIPKKAHSCKARYSRTGRTSEFSFLLFAQFQFWFNAHKIIKYTLINEHIYYVVHLYLDFDYDLNKTPNVKMLNLNSVHTAQKHHLFDVDKAHTHTSNDRNDNEKFVT